MKTALVFGATGLIGSNCLQQLISAGVYGRILVFVRKPLNPNNPNVTVHVINFENIGLSADLIKGDDLFYCIGTTMKKAGSKENFYKTDLLLAKEIASIASANGVGKFLLVSSIGADSKSSNFYLRVKGELEEEIKKLKFSSIHIFRPSILLGKREEKRFGEKAALCIFNNLSFLFIGALRKYKPVKAEYVSGAMIKKAQDDKNGIFIYESNEIYQLMNDIKK